MSKWRNRRLAIWDLAQLAEDRKLYRTRGRANPTTYQALLRKWAAKRLQMSLVLHRQGLVSPYDYTYPRLNQMSQLAKDLHAKHIVPIEQELDRLEATTRSTLAELDGAPAPAASDTEEVEPA